VATTAKVVSVALQAKVDGFISGMHKAKASVDDLTKAAAPSKADAFGKLADKAAVAGLGVATAVGVAVKRFADFDQAMSAVQANSGATGAALESLRAAAIKMGADSQFSASEAAQGINEMAKAGVATADILGGGLKGAMDLAAAGQISVADAAETAATAMTVFKLSGDKIPHVADLLANAANKAQGGVGDMSQALKQAGLVASGMGLSIEETTAGLTAFASAGLLGSDAGTSFKTMLQRLNAPTGEAKNLMDDLNISAYDSAGNFVGLANVAEQLKTSMEKMTPAQRAAANVGDLRF
jgi:TP901 family phage tail tape measure protein